MSAALEPVLVGNPSDVALTDQLLDPVWGPKRKTWGAAFLVTGLGTCMLLCLILYTFYEGIGVWGVNVPVAWAFAITNFVWWIGIGHAGTFISAILLLFEQKWRTSINRFAEAMTLFAVMQAGIFPLIHLGRPWFAYWLAPYPATMKVWPNFKSALPWDMAAVATYFTVSLLFWYLGLVPDLASVRDRAPTRWQRYVYGVFALGWRNSAHHQRHYRMAYGLLGGLATPLVLSVHSVVSSDFAITILPGWHSTIFPPYFVAGAIFSGFCMVATLMIPIRRVYGLQNVITTRHVENVCKMILLTGIIVDYSYLCEWYLAWYSGEQFEMWTMLHSLPSGPNAWAFWYTMFSNVVLVQIFWSKRARTSELLVWVVTIFINLGMWTERFSIIALSLQQDFLPSSWHAFHPSPVDWGLCLGTGCCFAFLFLLFLRFVPFVPLAELKELKAEVKPRRHV
ncbi:MAG TPA: NrfD/PsrC family molybdoenzyme membrane anchor subunit [Polyangia bacterium]|nr:NrfD/PsrC family molybdoenzyme membrane anchor subunit [Polyangia bacterium]